MIQDAANDLGRGYSARRVTAAILRDSGRGVPLGGELLAVIHEVVPPVEQHMTAPMPTL